MKYGKMFKPAPCRIPAKLPQTEHDTTSLTPCFSCQAALPYLIGGGWRDCTHTESSKSISTPPIFYFYFFCYVIARKCLLKSKYSQIPEYFYSSSIHMINAHLCQNKTSTRYILLKYDFQAFFWLFFFYNAANQRVSSNKLNNVR